MIGGLSSESGHHRVNEPEPLRTMFRVIMALHLGICSVLSSVVSAIKRRTVSYSGPDPKSEHEILSDTPDSNKGGADSVRWTAKCYPRVKEVTNEVDNYFLDRWDFPTQRAREKFIASGFSRVTCLYFPLALDDRIHFACRLLTVLFLIDGESKSTDKVLNKVSRSALTLARHFGNHVAGGGGSLQFKADSHLKG